jgi:hypothetical protein
MCFWVRVGWERNLSFQNEPKVDNGGRPLMYGHVYARLCLLLPAASHQQIRRFTLKFYNVFIRVANSVKPPNFIAYLTKSCMALERSALYSSVQTLEVWNELIYVFNLWGG